LNGPDDAQAPALHLATATLPARDRLPVWREAFGQRMVRLEIEPLRDTPFQAEGALQLLPGAALASVTSTPFRARRTRQLIQGDACDMTILVTATAPFHVRHCGREAVLAAGEAIFLRSGERSDIQSPHAAHFTNISVPTDSLAPLLPHAGDLAMTVIPRQDELLGLLVDYAALLQARHDSASGALRLLGAAHVRDLLAAVAGAQPGGAAPERGGIRAARRHAIRADILAHLCEPGLSIDTVAASQGISPRYIRKLLHEEQTSFSDVVLGLRLEQAHRRLLHPGYAMETIASLAHACGFGDLSYFNRCFRRRFGITPSQLRNGLR